jgi:hypothetical protein
VSDELPDILNNSTESLNKFLRAIVAKVAVDMAIDISFVSDENAETVFPYCVRVYYLAEDGVSASRNDYATMLQLSVFASGDNSINIVRKITRKLTQKLGMSIENSVYECIIPQFDYEANRGSFGPRPLQDMTLELNSVWQIFACITKTDF